MTVLRRLAVALVACGLGVCAACGGGGGVGKVTQSTTTVTTVACDGSKTTTVVTTPADGSTSTQGGIVGQGTPQTAGGFSTPTPVPTPRIVQGARIVLADVDSGSTIVVTVGTEILVALGPQTAPFCSSAPTTSDPGTLMQLSSSSGNDRSAHGRFVARSVGTALIEATIDPRCYPPCGAASARWQVTVEVIR